MKIFSSESYLIIFFILGASILFYILLTILYKGKAKGTSSIDFSDYHLKESLLTKNEMGFYETLKKVVEDDLIVFSMVRLADIFSIDRGKEYQSALNRINSRHVDFLLCHKFTLKPVVAIELDDKSHERSDRIKRDKFVNQLFESAGLPLLRYPSKNRYTPNDVGGKLNSILMKTNE
jgi:hypothetical protein